MAFVVTVHGGSAGLLVSASGSLGPFGSYSSILTESAHFGSGSLTAVGSSSLTVDTPFGDFTFTGTDTISAVSGHYSLTGSSGFSFVFGTDTVSLFQNHTTGTAATTSAATDSLNKFFTSSIAHDTVAGAAQHFLLPTGITETPGVAAVSSHSATGATTTEHKLSDGTTIFVKST